MDLGIKICGPSSAPKESRTDPDVAHCAIGECQHIWQLRPVFVICIPSELPRGQLRLRLCQQGRERGLCMHHAYARLQFGIRGFE